MNKQRSYFMGIAHLSSNIHELMHLCEENTYQESNLFYWCSLRQFNKQITCKISASLTNTFKLSKKNYLGYELVILHQQQHHCDWDLLKCGFAQEGFGFAPPGCPLAFPSLSS